MEIESTKNTSSNCNKHLFRRIEDSTSREQRPLKMESRSMLQHSKGQSSLASGSRSTRTLFVQLPDGSRFKLQVDHLDKIREVKAKLHNDQAIPESQIFLTYNGILLDNEEYVPSRDHDTIFLYPSEFEAKDALDSLEGVPVPRPRDMEIYVVTRMGRRLPLSVRISDTFGFVKDEIEKHYGLPRDQQILIFAGKILKNDEILLHCNIHQGSCLWLIAQPAPRASTSTEHSPYEPPPSDEDEANLLYSYKNTVGKFRERIEAIRGPRGEQAYTIQQISRQLPLESESTSISDPDQDIHGHIAYFAPREVFREHNGTRYQNFQVHKFPVADIVKGREALFQMDTLWQWELPERKPRFRWIHLPANNMDWDAMFWLQLHRFNSENLEHGEQRASLMQSCVLQDTYFKGLERNSSQNPAFSRSMRPACENIKIDSDITETEELGNSMVLFMPYLHWETSIAAAHTRLIVDDRTESQVNRRQLQNLPCAIDEKLIRRYAPASGGPLHLRKTLDSFFHTTLADTSARDQDQVVDKFVRRNPGSFAHDLPILMVDQCWLWLIEGDTIITCMPQRWGTLGDNYSHGEVVDDLLKSLYERPIREEIISAGQLALHIIESCKTRFFDSPLQFSSIFSQFISDLTEKQNGSLKRLWRDIKSTDPTRIDSLFDISDEFGMLEDIMDINEELQMISKIDEEQKKATLGLDDIGWLRDLPGRADQPDQTHHLRALQERAYSTKQSILDLVSFKQQQSSMSEARSSRKAAEEMEKLAKEADKSAKEDRKQSESIMLFTIVTILFLPLSTLATLFGMNARELGQGDLSIRIIFAYIIPISAFIVSVSLLLALNSTLRKLCLLFLQLMGAYLALVLPTGTTDKVLKLLDEKLKKVKERRKPESNTQLEHGQSESESDKA